MAGSPTIRVEGLSELSRALKKADAELAKDLRKGLKVVADDFARKLAGKLPRRSGRLAESWSGRATQRSASVASRVPYAGFIEFGNKPHAGGGIGRGDSHPRAYVARGRYIFPAAEAERGHLERALEDMIDDLIGKVGLD